MPAVDAEGLMEKFRAMAARGEPIVGGGAGTGLSAKCEEAGGVDLIVIYNSGRYRMAGRGSLAGLLAYGDANAIVVDMAREVLPVVKRTPVLAGVNGTDPFRDMDVFLDEIKAIGFCRRAELSDRRADRRHCSAPIWRRPAWATALEVDMIAKAHAKDLLTTPYVFNASEAEAMARAGADIIVCHMGLTTGGTIGAATARTLADCPALIDAWAAAALAVRPDILVLAHGGPIAEPADADFVMKPCKDCHGFYGASSMERLPVETALTEQVLKFKAIGRGPSRAFEPPRERPKGGGRGDVGAADRDADPLADHRDHRDRDRRLCRELALSPIVERGRRSCGPASSGSGS